MQFLDCRQSRQPKGFASDHDGQRYRRNGCEPKAKKAKALAARKQILDQVDDAKPEAEQHKSAGRGPEYRAPAEAAPDRDERRVDWHRQQGGIGFRRDMDRAAGRAAGVIRIDHEDAGIVELEGRRPPMRRFLAHCSLSPIRNWRARSRRM